MSCRLPRRSALAAAAAAPLALAAASWLPAPAAAAAGPDGGTIDTFTIGVEEVVAPGVPGPGAGEIEAPGNADVYELTLVAGQRVLFDNLENSNISLRWRAFDPSGEQVFSAGIGSTAGPFEITPELAGTWEIVVDDNADAIGTYSFTVWDTRVDGPFAIDYEDVVAPGVPGSGAGEIEEPGDRDIYLIDVDAGDLVFFDSLDASNASLRWRAFDASGEQVFSAGIFSHFGPVEVQPDQAGTWEIVVDDNVDAVGTYSFTVWESDVDGPYPIELEVAVSPGVPAAGAGEIEEPGDEDRYELEVEAGQRLFFDNLDASNASLRWRGFDANGEQVFSAGIFSQPGPILVEPDQAGTWEIVVDDNVDVTGTYSFIVWETNVEGPFPVTLESPVGPGVPAAGAGEIEEPGDEDRYELTVSAGQTLFFDSLGSSNASLRWRAFDPGGEQVFSAGIFSDRGPIVVEPEQAGTWEIVVDDNVDAVGTYEFIVWETDDDAFPLAINQVVDVDVPGPGAGWIEDPGNVDRYLIEGSAGDEWCAVNLATDNVSLRWRLLDPEGAELFDVGIISDQPSLPLRLDGTYVLEVYDNVDAVGTYSLVVNLTGPADVTADCIVGFDDLLAVLSSFGPCGDPSDCPEDVDGDGTVGFTDILEVLSAWTQ